MTEITLKIEEHYLQTFLDFLKTLNYISIQEVSCKEQKTNGVAATKVSPQGSNESYKKYIQPLEEKTVLAKLIREQNYQGPDKQHFKQLVKTLDIQEPIEDLLNGLTK